MPSAFNSKRGCGGNALVCAGQAIEVNNDATARKAAGKVENSEKRLRICDFTRTSDV
jgi:hypothetical protein